MQRLPGDFSVLDNRLERPAPNDSVEGDEIVRSARKRAGTVNPLVPGSSPGGPTNSILSPEYAAEALKGQARTRLGITPRVLHLGYRRGSSFIVSRKRERNIVSVIQYGLINTFRGGRAINKKFPIEEWIRR